MLGDWHCFWSLMKSDDKWVPRLVVAAFCRHNELRLVSRIAEPRRRCTMHDTLHNANNAEARFLQKVYNFLSLRFSRCAKPRVPGWWATYGSVALNVFFSEKELKLKKLQPRHRGGFASAAALLALTCVAVAFWAFWLWRQYSRLRILQEQNAETMHSLLDGCKPYAGSRHSDTCDKITQGYSQILQTRKVFGAEHPLSARCKTRLIASH